MFTVHTQNFITYTAVLTIQTTMGLIYTKCIYFVQSPVFINTAMIVVWKTPNI